MENIYSLVHLLTMKQYKVFLVCNENLNELIKEREKIEQVFLVPTELKPIRVQKEVLRLTRKIIGDKKIDTIIFGTTEIKPVRNILPLLPRINMLGIVHDALKLDSSGTFKYIYSFRIKKYFVFGDFIKNNLKRSIKQKLFAFYPCYFPILSVNEAPVKIEGEKWIIVPGVVKGERKDYIPLLKKVLAVGMPGNIKIIFLGKLYKEELEIVDLVQKINHHEQNIKTFDEFLTYDLFHSYLQKADFILPLLKISEDFFYGNTKISGAFNLAYSYRLPMLLPDSYKKNTDLTPFSVYYKSMDELYQLLLSINSNRMNTMEIKNSYRASKKFDFNTMADEIASFINE